MTYCVAIKVADGLVALSDGRITAGTQLSSARKIALIGPEGSQFLVMTSGLRSLRDKTVAYLKRMMAKKTAGYDSLLDVAADYSACLRRVREEDEKDLAASDLRFNLHTIIGGKMAQDAEPTFLLIYPEGNWIEVDERTPYLSIGETSYGKPILDRALRPATDLRTALKLAYLSFDSTRISAADVGFPIDMLVYLPQENSWRETQYDYDELIEQRQWWNSRLKQLAHDMPDGPWAEELCPPRERLTVVPDKSSA